ncbi:hypothetical protein GX50_00789 [[Emmonsia] crescens]|uniref:Uncharacterized protein n=1 Tax=[Emmonsia] crescens TaxID=73230 RepID=A0A2B7ZIH3_9EURO|nr:hypothetical protein GX50_00789 [Emmonsia crescens]
MFRNLMLLTAEGNNPHVTFSFTELKIIRSSQFNGATGGPIVAHLFNDGTIKTPTAMHEENNRRKAEGTTARKQAEARKMARIYTARTNASWSIIQKQLEKDSAEQEYQLFLQVQSQERVSATEG